MLLNTNKRKGIFAVEIASDIGIGAVLTMALETFSVAERFNLEPYFQFRRIDCTDRRDQFGLLFSAVNKSSQAGRLPRFLKVGNLDNLAITRPELTVTWANELIRKRLVLKREISDQIEQFAADYFQQRSVLGIHYRGTDKSREAPRVEYSKVLRNVQEYVKRFPETNAVFVASDEAKFIEFMMNSLPELPVLVHNDSHRSHGEVPVHHSGQDIYALNVDAIVNSYLLSRCTGLIKSASFLSAFSVLLNPKIRLVMLNEPFEHCSWFPDRELKKLTVYKAIA